MLDQSEKHQGADTARAVSVNFLSSARYYYSIPQGKQPRIAAGILVSEGRMHVTRRTQGELRTRANLHVRSSSGCLSRYSTPPAASFARATGERRR